MHLRKISIYIWIYICVKCIWYSKNKTLLLKAPSMFIRILFRVKEQVIDRINFPNIFDRSIVDLYREIVSFNSAAAAVENKLGRIWRAFAVETRAGRRKNERGNSNSANIAVNRRWHSRSSVDQLDKCPKRSIDDSEPRRSRLWDLEHRLDDISINLKGTLFDDWFDDEIARIWFFWCRLKATQV